MNRSTFRHAIITIAALIGVLAGVVLPKPAHAAFIYNVYVHPTADTLSCGWHDGACWAYPTPVPSGWALDWHTILPNSSFNVYFYVKSDNGAGAVSAGTGTITYSTVSHCSHLLTVPIKDPNGVERGRARYQHTASTSTGTVIPIASGYTRRLPANKWESPLTRVPHRQTVPVLGMASMFTRNR